MPTEPGSGRPIATRIDFESSRLRGEHNLQNALAAAIAARFVGRR